MLKSNFFNKNKNFWSALLKYMYLRWFFHSSYITIQPYLGWLFENLKSGLVGPRWKNMLYLRKPLSTLHEILYIYCLDNMK